ncbi:DNA polymerase III subunit delta' C-terminal domain-containing protein [Acidithiobacillus sp. M4-SHS-6]|uniref:DNA polymerase III subunit delta' C-terminal domain-containing protein n=1 Tax=Acidithiobacillus sp. M4-SHS-6 TaxID=3383024 RepID=UPI0039BE1CF3
MKLFRPDPHAWQPIRALLSSGLPQAMLAAGEPGSLLGWYLDLLQAAQLCFMPTDDGFACGDCRSCKLLAEAAHPDLWIVAAEPGKAIAIDALRQGMEWIHYTPQVSATRWLRIDHAEAMTVAAANAILKTLEEPPARAHVLLHSEQISRLLPTIRSRLQRIPLPVMEMAESRQWLQQQGIDAENSMALLRQLGNRPVRALELWEAGWIDQRREWMRHMLDLPGQGVVAALKLAEQWSKSADLFLIREMVLGLIADFMRLQQGLLDRIADLDYLDELQPIAPDISAEALQATLDDWLQLPLTLAQNSNGVMVMEKLLLDWLKLWPRRTSHGVQN